MTRTSFHRGHRTPQRGPEQTVKVVQQWSRSFAFEHGDLLTLSKDFK